MSRFSIYIIGLITASYLTGCVTHYKDVKGDNYAHLQLISKSANSDSDYYFAEISDYSQGCGGIVSLGHLVTNTQTSSRVIKIPADKALQIHVKYTMDSYGDISFILTPEKNRHYIVEYKEKEKTYYVYTKNGKNVYDVPESRLRMFHVRECL